MPKIKADLGGARIWLSAAVPDLSDDISKTQREAIRNFIRELAARVFRANGLIIHGSHPSVRGILLEEAERYLKDQENNAAIAPLLLCVSHLHSDDPNSGVDLEGWSRVCRVLPTPKATRGDIFERSLAILRGEMAARCDAMIAIGGRWWDSQPTRAGVPEEIRLTSEQRLPCFLLGGFAGAAKGFLNDRPDLLQELRNGFCEEENVRLSTQTDLNNLAEILVNQLSRLPLVRSKADYGTRFRILALDGGGIMGTFTAAVLAQLQHKLEEEHRFRQEKGEKQGELVGVAEHFDLIAGTSTGGILALGLGLGLPPRKMLDFYVTDGPDVFPMTSIDKRVRRNLRSVFKSKFDQGTLLKKLDEAYSNLFLGDEDEGSIAPQHKTLTDSRTRLVIPSCHAETGTPRVFRTPHAPDLHSDGSLQAAEVALATAAAPVYFESATVHADVAIQRFLDGGLWANNPVLTAVIEATSHLGVPLDRIDVLSIGTTTVPYTDRRWLGFGVAGWAPKLLTLFMRLQAQGSHMLAQDLAGDAHVLRLDKVLPKNEVSLDNIKMIGKLADLGVSLADEPATFAAVRRQFLNGVPAERWEPFSAVLPLWQR